jgi:hypothetical protein
MKIAILHYRAVNLAEQGYQVRVIAGSGAQ